MRCSLSVAEHLVARTSLHSRANASLPQNKPQFPRTNPRNLEDAINLLDHQPPTFHTYVRLINECTSLKHLSFGRRVHAHINSKGYGDDKFLGKLLINLYSNCRQPHEAWKVFSKLSDADIVSWNMMIGAFAKHGYGREAIRLFDQMVLGGIHPDERTLTAVLSACCKPSDLAKGKQIHALISDRGLESHLILRTALVNMYSSCGSLRDAESVFYSMPIWDIISWNSMIAAYVRHGVGRSALELKKEMISRGLRPDKITFVSCLSACASLGCLQEAKEIHSQLMHSGLEVGLVLSNALVNMYSCCGSLADAHEIFEKMLQRDVISWNTIIAAYAQHGDQRKAFELYEQMMKEGVKSNRVTYINILNALESSQFLEYGKAIHRHIAENGFQFDVVLGTALLNMYSRCGSIEDAVGIFIMLFERDAIAWNAIIAVYSQHGQNQAAIRAFAQMQWEGVRADKVTFVNLLDACGNSGSLELGRTLQAHFNISDMQADAILGNTLANMFVKCGSLEEAWMVFEMMPVRDVVSWNTIIGAYAQFGCRETVLKLFKQMRDEGVEPNKVTIMNALHAMKSPAALEDGKFIHALTKETGLKDDVSVGNALINMYSCCGSLEDARKVFDEMPQRDVITLNVMIGAFVQHGKGAEGLQLFEHMQSKGLKLDEITLVNVIEACSSLAALAEGKSIHAYAIDSGFKGNVAVENALVNMYGKCGSFLDALDQFEKMTYRDIVTWNAIIEISNQHGHGSLAIQLFGQMQWEEMRPDRIGFVSILSACSHAGNIDGGCHYFTSAGIINLLLTADHYGCLVDLFCRAGQLDEAENFIITSPFEGDSVMWMNLLGACRVYGDIERGRRAAEQVIKLEPNNAAPYVLLSHVYAGAGEWDEAKRS